MTTRSTSFGETGPRTLNEGSDESIIYLDEVKGISAKQVETLSKAEIHTCEDCLTTAPIHIMSLKGMGMKTVEKLRRLSQEAIDTQSALEKESELDTENEGAPSLLEEVENS